MTAGVVAEYNPFHQGHACHLAKIHEKLGDNTPIVVVMSGAFVQRGEPAFIDPFLRTRMALKEGADLVLQLPTYYASATAEWFAIGGIQTLVKSGIVDTISFGMEDPSSLPLLQDTAALLSPETEAYRSELKHALETESSFAKAREKAIESLLGKSLPKEPNTILALEYLKAIRSVPDWDPALLPIQREGMGYLDTIPLESLEMISKKTAVAPSALAIRTLARQNKPIDNMLTEGGKELLLKAKEDPSFQYVFPEALYPALSFRLSQHTPATLREIDEISEGLENRILQAFVQTKDYDSLLEALKTKRYPTSRLKRILLNIVLDITKERKQELSFQDGPPYLRVLGVRQDSLSLLSALKQNAAVPVVINLAKDIDPLPETAKAMLQDELRFSRYYATLCPTYPKNELSQGLIIE